MAFGVMAEMPLDLHSAAVCHHPDGGVHTCFAADTSFLGVGDIAPGGFVGRSSSSSRVGVRGLHQRLDGPEAFLAASASAPSAAALPSRAELAEQWFAAAPLRRRPLPSAFHGAEPAAGHSAADKAWNHAWAGMKTCLMALTASTAAWINAYVGYNLEKEHYEHELHEMEALRRGESPGAHHH
eukprot:TRINITY_DN2681_c0_g1_i1.p1 TRINITY_DN2681_c0_g1~~TRINITY_DN2681_c0_g1_i1.p1  ORF type:complete len:183 (-),score=41.76 TRINITY_DN2681_c0_g1_i1:200-748(-)